MLKYRPNFLKNLRGVPELVVATVGETEAVPRFQENPVFDKLAHEQGDPLTGSYTSFVRGMGAVPNLRSEVRKLYHTRISGFSPNCIILD